MLGERWIDIKQLLITSVKIQSTKYEIKCNWPNKVCKVILYHIIPNLINYYVIKSQKNYQKGSAWIPGMLANILEPRKENKQKRLKTGDLINITIVKDFGWGPIHTSNLRPVCWAFSLKTHRFERLLKVDQTKLIHIVLVWMVKNGRKCIKVKMMTKTIACTLFACVCSMCIDFNWHHNIQFYHFWMCWCGRSKTRQK